MFESSSGRFACSFNGHVNWVRGTALNRDTTLAVTGSDDKTVKLWDVATHKCRHTFYEHNRYLYICQFIEPLFALCSAHACLLACSAVSAVAFHPQGTVIAAAGDDGCIKLWDLRSNRLIQHYSAHSAGVTSISCHPSGDFLLSSSNDGSLKV